MRKADELLIIRRIPPGQHLPLLFGLDRPGWPPSSISTPGTETLYGDDYTVEDIVWRRGLSRQSPCKARRGSLGPRRFAKLAELLRTPAKPGRPGSPSSAVSGGKQSQAPALGSGLDPERVSRKASVELIPGGRRAAGRQRAGRDRRNRQGRRHLQRRCTFGHADGPAWDMESDIAAEVRPGRLAAGATSPSPIIATVHGETLL